MSPRLSRVPVLCTCAVLLIALAGCGGSSSDDAAPQSAATSSSSVARSSGPAASSPDPSGPASSSSSSGTPPSAPGNPGAGAAPGQGTPPSGGAPPGSGSGPGVARTPAGAPPAAPGGPGVPPQVDPATVVAAAGDRGQEYLGELRKAGLPDVGLGAEEILFARGTCDALASGTSRDAALSEFASVGQAYSGVSGLPPDRVAVIFVDTARDHFC